MNDETWEKQWRAYILKLNGGLFWVDNDEDRKEVKKLMKQLIKITERNMEKVIKNEGLDSS